MKVGTLTFHNAWNYGGALQAYALQRTISSMGHGCEVIDYECPGITRSYKAIDTSDPVGFSKSLIRLPSTLRKRSAFREFRRDFMTVSSERYTPKTIARSNDIYDCFVVGSDQVWNPRLINGDPAFFLNFADSSKRLVSYAASLGTSDLTDSQRELLQQNGGRFDAVSVRESDAVELVKPFFNCNVTCVLDPVFLCTKSEWESFTQPSVAEMGYVFAYSLHEPGVYSYAERLAKQCGLSVKYIPFKQSQKCSGERVLPPSVGGFLTLIANAQYVVTDSFHVSAFSIIFGRQLFVYLKHSEGGLSGMNSRLMSLMAIAGISEDRFINSESDCEMDCINYDKVERNLTVAREASTSFLESALEGVI